MSVIKSRHIMQVNIVVDDIERVGRNYAKTFGIEMPEIWCHPGPNQAAFMYKGKFVDVGTVKICTFWFGEMALELIEVVDAPNSPWNDYIQEHGYGVHNIGFYVDDLPGALGAVVDTGAQVVSTGYFEGESYTIVNGEKEFGVRLNIKHKGEDNKALIEEHKLRKGLVYS